MNQKSVHRRSGPSRIGDVLFALQTEILINLARLVFSCFALLAVYLDPTWPKDYLDDTISLLSAYLVYSAVVLAISTRHTFGYFSKIVIHLFDIVILSLLIYLTDGLDSPFFSFYTFSLFSATMRWRWRGAIATAALLGALLLILSWEDIEIEFNRDSQLNVLVMRGAYLFVAAGLLGYFGAYMERSRVRLNRLANWPLEEKGLLDDPLPENSLRHAAQVLGCSRVLVFWRRTEDHEGKLTTWSEKFRGLIEIKDAEICSQLLTMVGRATFHPVDDRIGAKKINHVLSFLTDLNDQEVMEKPHSYGAAPFRSSHYEGCVFVLDPKYHSEDIVPLIRIVAMRIASELEQRVLAEELAQSAISEERMRLARDMHDSVLQDLTAASLLLKSISDRIEDKLEAPLNDARWLLTSQQRRIRNFLAETSGKQAVVESRPLAGHLNSLASVLGRQWRCQIEILISPPDLQVGSALSAEIFQLVCEATANAVRHGGATHITVQIAHHASGALRVEIADNGAGMSADEATEPQSIKKRVSALNGKLLLLSTAAGVQLSIDIPAQ